MLRKQSLLFLTVFIASCLFFFAATEEGFSGINPGQIDCCQLNEGGCYSFEEGEVVPLCDGEVFENESCNEAAGLCASQVSPITSSIPTMSEWGLAAMAAVLGIAGYIIARRRKVSA